MAKILVAEDEALVRMLIVETLAEWHHDVLEAADGEAGLTLVKAHSDLDLIVTDVRMPRMDGFSLALAARALMPGLGVVFMTGYRGADVPPALSSAPVLQKPFDPSDLILTVDRLLAGRG